MTKFALLAGAALAFAVTTPAYAKSSKASSGAQDQQRGTAEIPRCAHKIGSLAMALFPGLWWAAAIAVGLAIAGMLMLRVTHPPAGAVPLVAFGSHLSALTLFTVVGLGGLLLIAIAVLHHLIPPKQQYPLRAE